MLVFSAENINNIPSLSVIFSYLEDLSQNIQHLYESVSVTYIFHFSNWQTK